MLTTMSKKKKPTAEPATEPTPRSGTQINVWIDEDIGAALKRYIENSEPKVSKTSTVEIAIREFLRSIGQWPPPPTPKEKGGTSP